jgi:hypothetical protein
MDGNTSSLSYSPSPFQKPSTTDLVLNKVCGGGKWGREPTLQKERFWRRGSVWRLLYALDF